MLRLRMAERTNKNRLLDRLYVSRNEEGRCRKRRQHPFYPYWEGYTLSISVPRAEMGIEEVACSE